ncbi:MAG: imidazole glycerol phosphate synthase subunit HisH [Candidatus Dadabacteria bacterium]|nr:imidazole glycerol phosphate synthase subunit HisH [Candidatus Dadabacteria bacterium]
MISIVDYGMGNLRSVEKGFASQGIEVRVTEDPGDIEGSSGLVLPGVGAFGDCVRNLRERSMTGPIKDFIASGRPFLGICLGFQVLFESSEEAPGEEGLGIFGGKVVRFCVAEKKLKVPHMGWNRVSAPEQTRILEGIPQQSWFYFVHSYHVVSDEPGADVLLSDYGGEFEAGVISGNLSAFQFHPEKSSDYGLMILRNFSKLCLEN